MKFTAARSLARHIQAEYGACCTVPYGYGPNRYFARIYSSIGPSGKFQSGVSQAIDFESLEEFEVYRAFAENYKAQKEQEIRKHRPRSPIEIMIDKACGYGR